MGFIKRWLGFLMIFSVPVALPIQVVEQNRLGIWRRVLPRRPDRRLPSNTTALQPLEFLLQLADVRG